MTFLFPTADGGISNAQEALSTEFESKLQWIEDWLGFNIGVPERYQDNSVGGSAIPTNQPNGEMNITSGGILADYGRLDSKSPDFIKTKNTILKQRTQGTSAAANTYVEFGFINSSGHLIIFRYDQSVSANWYAVCKDGAGTTTQDTLVAYVASTYAKFEIRLSNTQAVFFINGVSVATITTNVTAFSLNLYWYAEHKGNPCGLVNDYFEVNQDR